MKMKKIIILLFILVFISPLPAFAGEYVLQKRFPTGVKDHTFEVAEKNIELCKAYEKNLNSFKDLPRAMVCERKINPEFTDFKKPEWKELDSWENREKVKQMEKFLWYRWPPEKFDNEEEWLTHLRNRIKEKKLSLSETWIDINNDGKIDHVLRYDYGECDPTNQSNFAHPGGRSFFVWDDEKKQLDSMVKTKSRLRYDIFIYKGRVYLDSFGSGKLGFKDGELSVYNSVSHIGDFGGAKICVYKYKNQQKGGK